MKQIIFIVFTCLFGFISCKINTINKTTLSFYNKDKSLESVEIINKVELSVIEKFLLTKTAFADKLPVKYFLKIEYSNGKTEEYSCNGYFLKDTQTYTNLNPNIKESFLEVINSKLPSDLQQ
jgi:hypothetical protein